MGWFLNFKEFTQATRSGRAEVVVAQTDAIDREASLYCIYESLGSQWRVA